MTTKRKTGKDYRNELDSLQRQEAKLKLTVNQRLLELVQAHPDIELPTSRAGGLKAEDVNHKWIIEDLNIDAVIEYIQAIETELANRHPHKQISINFTAGDISKPSECPHRSNVSDKYFCEHPSKSLRYCTWTTEFPDGCPIKKL